jgi:hypothetical protein
MSAQVILIKFPSRQRPERFFTALDACIDNIQDKENYFISATLDSDDETVNNEEFISRVRTRRNVGIEWGLSESKVDAINRSMPNIHWDILVVLSDDQFFNIFGWDTLVRTEMNNHFPNGDGYLHFKEKDSREYLCVQTICDRRYYERFNYVYHPEYKSLFCDNHQMKVAQMLGKYVYIPYELMIHKNPAYTEYGMERDELFNRQQEIGYSVDQQKFIEMQGRNFDIHLIQDK